MPRKGTVLLNPIRAILRKLGLRARPGHRADEELPRRLKPFLGFRNGFFVEAGANDGIAQSNTLRLERKLGWRGLLIEPIPELAAKCRKNRPGSTVENCALVASDTPDGSVTMHHCGLMSVLAGAMQPADEAAHLAKGQALQTIEPYDIRVPARTLCAVLDQHEVDRIDFMSLDVEGCELDVLKGLDLERYRPRLLLIEVRNRHTMDAFLQRRYEPVAALSAHATFQDVLYRARDA